MRIALLSSNVESVPPAGYGGTELVVHLLAEELVARGHDVTLFATGDSKTSAHLVSVLDTPLRTTSDILPRRWQAYDIRLLLQLQKIQERFDIIHNNMGWQALAYLDNLSCPSVTTNHNPIKPYCEEIYLAYKHLPYVSISDAYRKLNYGDELNYIATIYNGIDVSRFPTPNDDVERRFLLFIGRICEDKGTGPAIEIARRLKLPIKLAGKVDDADRAYYETHVEPFVGRDGVEFIGEVNHEQKVDLYRRAIATVYPIAFDEPFGLVMAESLACGTPLLAFNRGSVAEVLTDGETAVIGHTVDDLVSRYPELQRIDRQVCRERVSKLFSKERMVDGYLDAYKKVKAAARNGELVKK